MSSTTAPAADEAPQSTSSSGTPFSWLDGLRYGSMGFPLAFAALPLYVVLPNHYARSFDVPLAALGALLLGSRLLDACIDPLLGRWCDRLYARSLRAVLMAAWVAALALWLGFTLLFFPPVRDLQPLLIWAAACLAVTYCAYSALGIFHQSWGAKLGGNVAKRSRVVAWREGLGLPGVLVAAAAPGLWGLGATSAVLLCSLLAAGWLWSRGARPAQHGAPATDLRAPHATQQSPAAGLVLPFTRPAFRRLFAVYLINGIASAIPATLLLFFVQDRLQASADMEPVFLSVYFVAAALAIPLWVRVVQGLGLERSWLVSMLLSVAVFVFAAQLGQGDTAGFLAVCALSGLALGADLTFPAALLAGVIAASRDHGNAEGSYFGWWNFATKLNLALAAGLTLPVLGWLGYTPGSRDAQALQTLSAAYCLLPCALKLLAAFLLYTLLLRKTP